MVINFQQYLHNREHAPMGCGPMEECHVCKQQFGDVLAVDQTGTTHTLITKQDLVKYIILAMVGTTITTIYSEIVLKKIFKKKKD